MRTTLAIVLLAASLTSALGFTENELRGIYSQMRPIIRCGMTEDYFLSQYRKCAESVPFCDGSLVSGTQSGPCTDKLIFQNLRGPEPSIILNGHAFPKPVPVPPEHQKPKKQPAAS